MPAAGPDRRYGWAAATSAAAHVFVAALEDECEVTGDDGHHLQRVRRLRPGEAVTAADGTGDWRAYEIASVAPGGLSLVATGAVHTEPEPVPRVSVAVALTKGRGLDDVVAGLTELGVHRVEPLHTERAVSRQEAERADRAQQRWQHLAREAAMQSRRARVPEIAPVGELERVRGRDGLLVAARDGVVPAQLDPPEGGEWLVVVGPEGGLTPEELVSLDAPRVRVGHHVLRARTAALAVVAALAQHTTAVPDVVN
jgi:16S rRNA (uracil1498-N3)-methyltransferase